VYEPEDKLGLASLTGTVMRTGGTSALSGDEINEQLEFIAASMETGISREAGSASLSVLSKDREIGFRIFADVLMHPVFAQDKVDLAKKKELEAIRRRNDDPQDIAFRESPGARADAENGFRHYPRGHGRLSPDLCSAQHYDPGSVGGFQAGGDDRDHGEIVCGMGTFGSGHTFHTHPGIACGPQHSVCP
jgi:hypothetical protein